ncbi:MAG TPA: ribosomal protein L7/L12 [Solirubrobacter sp.]|nr:ribosomal protein L7/L12 [Solirubrobacter sp.]
MGFLSRLFSPTPADERWSTSGAAPAPPPAPEPPTTAADELAKFAALRDQGVLTEDEFAAKKAQLLALDPVAPVGGTVVLVDAGPKKINVIKLVREATGLGLREAKDLVEATPATVATGLDAHDAQALAGRLTGVGARVELH